MAKVAEYYEMGDISQLSVEELARIVVDMYKDLAVAINRKPDLIKRESDGLVSDVFLADGDININTNTLKIEMLAAHPTINTVTWVTLS